MLKFQDATIELYDTDGSIGAANGAGIGSGTFGSFQEAFENLNKMMVIEPDGNKSEQYKEAYERGNGPLTFV